MNTAFSVPFLFSLSSSPLSSTSIVTLTLPFPASLPGFSSPEVLLRSGIFPLYNSIGFTTWSLLSLFQEVQYGPRVLMNLQLLPFIFLLPASQALPKAGPAE